MSTTSTKTATVSTGSQHRADGPTLAAERRLHFGDVAVGGAGKTRQPLPSPAVAARGVVVPPDFAAQFGRASRSFLRSTAQVQAIEQAINDLRSGDGDDSLLLLAEARLAVALEKHLALEDKLSALIRSLSGGEPVRLEPSLYHAHEGIVYPAVEQGSLVFSLDSSGGWVAVRPAELLVRLG